MTLQRGPGWRDEMWRYRLRHGDHVVGTTVPDQLDLGGYCPACVADLPEPATDTQWEACRIPAAEWTQVKPDKENR